jgi:isoleucyl-tRNA synthetase
MTYPRSAEAQAEFVASPSFPKVENEVRGFWAADDTFVASVEARARDTEGGGIGSNEFVFYDGPPFANGLPHYGHLLTGYVKDVIPRFQTMLGRRVERRFGWDCHGLPAELEAERQLGLTSKAAIQGMGIAEFNKVCRESVLRYTHEWRDYVTRQARWVDFDNDYKTLDVTYMESVIWAFKGLYDKGLVYSGSRVLPYCWRDETPLSSHELRMDDDVYQDRQDPSVTVWVSLENGDRLLAWTTTPWTLPSNLAMAVGEDIDYVVVEHDGARYMLAEARLPAYQRELGEDAADRVVRRVPGRDLVGLRYEPLFPFLSDAATFGTENAFRVVTSDHVEVEGGTGVVHMAPAYGEDDQRVCEAFGIPVVLTVDDRARFTSVVPPYEGQHVFEANPNVVRDLQEAGRLFRLETYTHSYPHCWRCRSPLIYKAVESYFVQVTALRDRMGELNQGITWVPKHVKDGQFGKWLSGARDWSISRNRFWGTPIPVWVSDDPAHPRVDVYGSLDELEADFGVRPDDLHRPFVDALTRPNPDDPTGTSTMRRVPDVLDVWFDSGSMPFAQVHYPFENVEWFDHHYPGDFVVEYIGQTRGWFYTLHVLATALFDRPAFSTAMSHGIVLGSDGQKMSKSLRNYPDVNEVLDRDGADAMRWFLMASPVLRGGNLIVTEEGIREGVRHVVLPLWNAWYFFALYANAAGDGGYSASWNVSSTDLLDRYLLARTRQLVVQVRDQLATYDVAGACESIREHVDALTNWYIRRSRERFWDGDSESARLAFDTLYTTLEVTSRVAAPLLPMVTEHIWKGLTGGRSVHLEDWPDPDSLPDAPDFVAQMDAVRAVCSVAQSIRKANGLRVRLPLPSLTVSTEEPGLLRPFADLIAEEVNVRRVEVGSLDSASYTLVPNARVLGPRLGADVQHVIKAAKAGDFDGPAEDGSVVVHGHRLSADEYTLRATADTDPATRFEGGRIVRLDLTVTPEAEAEGWARDLVRLVQQARKDAGLAVSDHIRLTLRVPQDRRDALAVHVDSVARETLADEVVVGDPAEAVEVEVARLG